MDQEFYDKAYKANNKGNIGYGMPDLMSTITQGYATDSGMLVPGHRNWILNMYMQYTAFGEAGKASNMYAMDTSRKNVPDFDAICYPVSNFPTDFFDTTAAWSIQLGRQTKNPNIEKVKVTLTGGGKTWNFSNQSSDDEFKIEPVIGKIYFKPKGINGIFYSGEYTVKVTGLETKDGKEAELEYTVNFFDIKPTNAATPQPTATPTQTATPKPTSTPKPIATPTPAETAKPLVTIIKQPTSLTVTQGSISGSITMEATSSSGKITYKLKGVGNEMAKAEFKLSPTLPIGVYEYWFGVYLDGKFVMKSDVATVTVLKRDVSSGFLEILPYNRIEQGSLNSYEKVKGKPTVVVFGSSYGCTYPGISAGYKFIKNNLLEGKVNLLAFSYGMNEADAQTAAISGFKADWYTLYNSGDEQMWALLDSNGVNFPVIAYFDDNGNFIRYQTSNTALNNVETDFKEMLDISGVAISTPKPTPTPVSSLVTINKQPAPITMVTEGKITESIAISATASSGKLTYEWAISETDDTPPKGRLTQKVTPEFKLGSLKAGTYYYFCILYVDGKEALRSDIATIQVVKAEEATATNPETANMKKGINVVSLPTKTTYAIGEGFDTTGAKVVYNTGEKLNDVTANILFYTSKTVQLTEGRPFTTTGEKVVELRQTDGNVTGNYTITVHEKGAAAKHPFADVKSGAYYEAPVIWALQNNVTSGTSESTFSPNDTCTRGQVVTFLWRTKGQPEPTSSSNPFSDVNSNDYYYKAVLWAVENGITAGTSDATFSPNDLCTSAHVVTFLWRAKGKPTATVTNYSGEYFADAVAWADGEGLLSGTGTDFAPNNNSPRADIVTYLYRNAGSPDIQ